MSGLRSPDRAGAEAWYAVRGSDVARCQGDCIAASTPVRCVSAWSPPVSSPGGLRGAIYKTRVCPRMRGTPRPVLSEHRYTETLSKGALGTLVILGASTVLKARAITAVASVSQTSR